MKLSFDDRYIPHHAYLKMIENGYFEDEVRKDTKRLRRKFSAHIERMNILYNKDSNLVVTVWNEVDKTRFIAGYNCPLTSVDEELQRVYMVHDDMLLTIIGKAYHDKLIYSQGECRVPVRVKVMSIYNILNENVAMPYSKDIMIILIDYILRGLITNEIKY